MNNPIGITVVITLLILSPNILQAESHQPPMRQRIVGATAENPTNVPTASAAALKRVHAFISGKVQGVGFRDFTARQVATRKLLVTG
jgi:hypothetical protein